MLIKKFGSLILALTLVIACIPGTMATAAEAAWFDIEAEVGAGATNTNEAASSGSYLIANDTNRGISSTNSFELEADGTYDIWAVVGGDSAKNYLGKNVFTLDGDDEFYNKNSKDSADEAVGDALYETSNLASGAHPLPMKWVKIASAKAISAGSHTLTCAIGKETSSAGGAAGNGNDFGAIDVVRFVPSSWNWTPESNFDAPTPVEWVNLKISEATLSEGDFDGKHPNLTQVEEKYVAKADTDGATADWSFEVPLTKSYDVWVLCDDYDGNWESQRYLQINSDSQITIPSSGVYQFDSDISYGWNLGYYANYTFNLHWIKVTTREFTAGQSNTIRWSCLPRTSATDGNLTAVHSVRLVPTEWTWSPVAEDTTLAAPTDMRPTPDANGVIHLEAENGILSGGMTTGTNDSASNGSYGVVSGTATVGNPGSSTLGFKLEEAGTYDVWAAVATHQGTGAHIGGLSFDLDGTSIYKRGNGSVPRTNPELYSGMMLYNSTNTDFTATVRWVKLASLNIDAGGHTLVAATCESMSGGHTTGIIDCVRLVPVGNTFDISGFDQTLTFSSPDWHNLEAEDGILESADGIGVVGTDEYVYRQGSGNASALSSTSSFYAKGGKYDVWALVALEDRDNTTRLGVYRVYLNGTLIGERANNRVNVEWNSLYTVPGTNGVANIAQYMHWVKIGNSIDIPAGGNIINAKVEYSTNTTGAIDKVRVVPTSWNYVPTTTTAAPVAPEVLYDSFTLSDKVAGAAATATVTGIKKTVDAEKNAVVIVAVYKDNTLQSVYPSAITALSAEGQTISTSVNLPADLTDVTVKAFLWDGLSAAMPYADDIEK